MRSILIPTRGPRTIFDPFNRPVQAMNGKLTLRGGPYYGRGVTFENVFGTFRGAAITLAPDDTVLKVELVPVEKVGSIHR